MKRELIFLLFVSIQTVLSGLNLQGILNDLPDTLQATLKEVGEGVKKLLSGDPDVALNDVVKGVKEVTSTIRDNSKALTPVANLIDQLADKAVANPEDTAAVQNLARPILQLLNLTQGSSLSDLSGSIDDLLSGGGLGGLLGGVTGGK